MLLLLLLLTYYYYYYYCYYCYYYSQYFLPEAGDRELGCIRTPGPARLGCRDSARLLGARLGSAWLVGRHVHSTRAERYWRLVTGGVQQSVLNLSVLAVPLAYSRERGHGPLVWQKKGGGAEAALVQQEGGEAHALAVEFVGGHLQASVVEENLRAVLRVTPSAPLMRAISRAEPPSLMTIAAAC